DRRRAVRRTRRAVGGDLLLVRVLSWQDVLVEEGLHLRLQVERALTMCEVHGLFLQSLQCRTQQKRDSGAKVVESFAHGLSREIPVMNTFGDDRELEVAE